MHLTTDNNVVNAVQTVCDFTRFSMHFPVFRSAQPVALPGRVHIHVVLEPILADPKIVMDTWPSTQYPEVHLWSNPFSF